MMKKGRKMEEKTTEEEHLQGRKNGLHRARVLQCESALESERGAEKGQKFPHGFSQDEGSEISKGFRCPFPVGKKGPIDLQSILLFEDLALKPPHSGLCGCWHKKCTGQRGKSLSSQSVCGSIFFSGFLTVILPLPTTITIINQFRFSQREKGKI